MPFKCLNAQRERIAVIVNCPAQQPRERVGLFIGQVEHHLPQIGRLTNGGQHAVGNGGMWVAVSPNGARRAECRKSKPRLSSRSSRTRSVKQRGAILTPWRPASSPLWPKQAIVSFRPTGERTPHHAPRGQSPGS